MIEYQKLSITIHVPAGTNLQGAENAAIRLAIKENAVVKFAFNGTEYSVDPAKCRDVITTKKIEGL